MALPKIRVDAWKPKLQPVDTNGVLQTVVQPDKWVTVETYENLSLNQRRKNAVNGVEISDSLFVPRTANITLANRSQSFTAADNETYTYVYNDSDGVAAHTGTIRLKKKWGVLTKFFYEFQHIRLVDLETYLVLFTGRIYSVKLKYEGTRGSIIQLKCKDNLEELNSISCKNLGVRYDFTTSHRRSDMVQAMLNVGLNELASLPAGGREKIQTSPVVNNLSGTTYNVVSDNNATNDTEIPYARFERSKEVLEHAVEWEPQRSGAKKLLSEIVRVAIAEPHNDETADDQFGYDLYTDSNIGVENLSASEAPPPAMFNYFKRGNRLSDVGTDSNRTDPAYFGLTVKMPITNTAVSGGHKKASSGTDYATRLMHRNFDFENPQDEIFTEVVLTYEARLDVGVDGGGATSQRIIRDKKFEIINVNQLNGQFTYAGKDIDDEWKDSDAIASFDAAETLDAYNIADVKQATACARIQWQADTGGSPSATYKAILVSDIKSTFPTSNYGSDTYVVLKGSRSGSSCRFNADATLASEGRPSKVWNIHKVFNFTQITIAHPDELRKEVFSRLRHANEAVRRGTYTVSKAPYYWLDGKVHSISSLFPKGQRITFKHDNGSASEKLSTYGIREGMLVHKRTSDYSKIYQTVVTKKDVYGYIFNMLDDSNIDVDLTESENFAVDDKIRIIIPLRAGDIVQTDNVLADVNGNHLITELVYTEWPNPMTQIQSIGKNEIRVGAVKKPTVWTPYAKDSDIEETRPGIKGSPRGNQTFTTDVVFSQPASNRIDWTSGNITTADGITYQVVSGSTNDATYGLGGAMTGTNKYILYLDPYGENPSSNSYHIYTKISTSYKPNVDHIRIGVGSVATTGTAANFKASSNADDDGTMGAKFDANTTIHAGSIDDDLVKAASLTGGKLVNGTITGVKIGDNEIVAAKIATNQISADHLQANSVTTNKILAGNVVADSIASNAVTSAKASIGVAGGRHTYGGTFSAKSGAQHTDTSWTAGTLTLPDGSTYSIGAGSTSYASTSVTFYIYFDKDASTTAFQSTQTLATAIGDNKVHIVVVTPTSDTNSSIGISHNNNEAQTIINANGIRTNSVVADLIAAGAVSATKLSSTALDTHTITLSSGGKFVTTSGTTRATGGAQSLATGSGVLIDQYGIIGATGTGTANVEFYLDSSNGRGVFGGGNIQLHKGGVFFDSGAGNATKSIEWEHESGGTTTWLYRNLGAKTLSLFSDASTSDAAFLCRVQLGTSAFSVPSAYFSGTVTVANITATGTVTGFPGGVDLSDNNTWTGTNTWTAASTWQASINTMGNDYSDIFVVNSQLRVQDGTATNPAIARHSDGDTGFYFYDSGSYSLTSLRSNGRTIWYGGSDGTNDYFYCDSHLDLNNHTIYDTYEIRVSNGASNDPSFTFTSYPTTGIYAESGDIKFTRASQTKFQIGSSANVSRQDLDPSGSYDLGSATKRWSTVYCASLNESSDENKKENKQPLTNCLGFIDGLSPIQFNFIGESKNRFGLTAQNVKQILIDKGYEKNIIYSEEDQIDEDGTPTGEIEWGLRYTEFIAPLIGAIQELKAEIEILKAKLV